MSLPGKLCIGILEEDNPLKSYFRFKPLLIEEEGRYVPYAQPDVYPVDGCIRIVPDKNESYHFKSRMRRIGLFCVVDLRAHPDDNDKIRPNKNFREDTPEQNAYIIYSDVVREPAPDMIFEILSEEVRDTTLPLPRTAHVLLKGDRLLPQCYAWEALPDTDDKAQLLPTDRLCPEDSVQVFELNGFRDNIIRFAIVPPAGLERISDAPAPKPAKPAPIDHAGPAPAAVVPTTPANPVKKAPAPAEAPAPSEAPAPAKAPAPSEAPAKAPAPVVESPASEKPWIHHDASITPRPVDPRLSPAQRNLAVQSGLNPRRGRSLQELIDEKWQRSRLNQLGMPIAPIQTGAPVSSPVDNAVQAVRQVWQQPQLREDLLKSLSGIEEFGASLEECREAVRQSDIEQHLNNLEARRLALLSELDHLNLKNADVRQALKQELRRDAEADLAQAVQRADAARAEQAEYEKQAETARAAAEDARKAVDALTGETLEQYLSRFALTEHMLDRMQALKGEADAIPPAAPALQNIDLNTLAVRVMNRFDASGFAITRLQALNLCVCAALSPVLILSGPVGSGKTSAARMLTEALGWTDINRFVVFAPGQQVSEGDPRLKALKRQPQVPAMIMLDDANLYPSVDPLHGLDAGLSPNWRLCLTVQDGGQPLSDHTLDRGFTLRLDPKPATPWRPRPRATCASEAPASLNLTVPEAPLPAAMDARMEALRAVLNRIGAPVSRRALDDTWRYCALMIWALGENADPIAVLDRAVAQRLLPGLLASASPNALVHLNAALEGLPLSRALLNQPLPISL